ncbi:MAG: isochorismatase family protein [Actinomycetota bacterium]|nr:MAG: isochorismatase family protein [Actinomycetota bacterium]
MRMDKSLEERFEDHCWRDVITEETLQVYRPYVREVGLKGQAALLSIDLFASVFPSGPMPLLDAIAENPKSCGPYAWEAKPKIKRLLDFARKSGWPIIQTTSDRLLVPEDENRRATNRDESSLSTSQITSDFAIDEYFEVQPEDRIIYKGRASAFFGTDLAQYLRSNAIETVVICGESTSGCVRSSAVDGFSHGFHVVVVEDCVFDRHLLSHKVSLFDLHHKYADVMMLEELDA